MLEQFYRIDRAAGVSIFIGQDGLQINACGIAIDQQRLDFLKKVSGQVTVEGLAKHLPAKSIISLNLSGKGILHKQIERSELIDQQAFGLILPNANQDDFYIQNFISGAYSFVSVIRKIEADKYISQLHQQGFVPLMLSLGPFPVYHIIPQLNVYNQDLVFSGNTIKRNEQAEWLSCTYNEGISAPFPIKVESEGISEQLVIPYAAVFQLVLAQKIEPVQVTGTDLETQYHDVITDKKIKVQGLLILGFFFMALLINYLLFSWLNSANTVLADKVSRFTQSNMDVQGINDRIRQKQALLQDLGWDGSINKSILIDKLASLLPGGVTWQEVTVNPIDVSASRVQKSILFFDRQIRVTGISEKIIPVNEWIARVKTLPWVKNIQLESYAFNNELNTGQFTVVINY